MGIDAASVRVPSDARAQGAEGPARVSPASCRRASVGPQLGEPQPSRRSAWQTAPWTLCPSSSASAPALVGRRCCFRAPSDLPATLPADEEKSQIVVPRRLVIRPRAERGKGTLSMLDMAELAEQSRRLAVSCTGESMRALAAVQDSELRRMRDTAATMRRAAHPRQRQRSHGLAPRLRLITPRRRGSGRPAGSRRAAARSRSPGGGESSDPGEGEPAEGRRKEGLNAAADPHRLVLPGRIGRVRLRSSLLRGGRAGVRW
jgi:hypothetical protein